MKTKAPVDIITSIYRQQIANRHFPQPEVEILMMLNLQLMEAKSQDDRAGVDNLAERIRHQLVRMDITRAEEL